MESPPWTLNRGAGVPPHTSSPQTAATNRRQTLLPGKRKATLQPCSGCCPLGSALGAHESLWWASIKCLSPSRYCASGRTVAGTRQSPPKCPSSLTTPVRCTLPPTAGCLCFTRSQKCSHVYTCICTHMHLQAHTHTHTSLASHPSTRSGPRAKVRRNRTDGGMRWLSRPSLGRRGEQRWRGDRAGVAVWAGRQSQVSRRGSLQGAPMGI